VIERAAWGFTNKTDIVTLENGERIVVQRYRRPQDAAHRLRVMDALREPAAAAGIAIPRVRESNLDADPAWVVFEALPGAAVPDAVRLDGPGFPEIARAMGELLAVFRELPTPELGDLWTDPQRLAAAGADWAEQVLDPTERAKAAALIERVPVLFAGRPAVLAHGDFAPVNVLVDDGAITGLLDFEAVRLADPLFDVAWWAWSVSFGPREAFDTAWPEFLAGAGVDAADPDLPERLRALQVLRMLELVAGKILESGVARIVADRLRLTFG
jgi:aminoglycoside phosphotransferase (APT) family kinase protein